MTGGGGAGSPQNRRAFFSLVRLIRPLRLTRWVYPSIVIYGQEVLYAARGQEARSRPAQAGIQERRSRDVQWPPGFAGARLCGLPVSCHSRKAGMTCFNHWIPAFAGMTARVDSSLRRDDGRGGFQFPPLRVNTTSKIDAMRLSPHRHLWTGSPVCGERAGGP